jgi:hypothetical protein
MVSRLQKFIKSVVDFVKKAKIALTWKVFGSYLLVALPLVFVFAILVDIGLYVVDPMRLPLPIIRLGTIAWAILAGLVSAVVVLLASKRFLSWLGQLWGFVKGSLPTRQLKLAVSIACVITALIYPCYQVIASYSGSPRTAIPNTPYTGTVVVNDPLTSNRLRWDAPPSQKGSCTFTDAGYEVRAGDVNNPQACFAAKTNFGDFALQAEMTLEKGAVGGILFRNSYLLILIGNPYTTGFFDLYVYMQNRDRANLTPSCDPLQVQTGCPIGESFAPQQTVTITIVARGTSIDLYVDTHKVQTLTNGVSSTGQVGVFAEIANGQPDTQTDVLFANMRIWTDIA